MSLKKQAVHGVKWTTVSAVVAASTQLLQVAVLAHFLNKSDFGLMALALVVINMSQIFIDMGISNAIIYKQNVSHNELSSLYWMNIFLGVIVFLILFLIAPLAAYFYREPELRSIINWVGIAFLIQPFGQQFEVLLKKELKFKSLAIRDIISRIIGLIVAVVLAYYNYGVYALVFANLTAITVSTIVLIYPGSKIHKPGFIFKFKYIKNFFSFGMFQMGEQIINYFSAQFDTIIIGKLLGVGPLGIYNVAKTVTFKPWQILNPIITKVSFPVMARIQDNLEKVRKIYLTTVSFLTSVISPLYFFMFVFATPIVLTVFGKDWTDAILIMRLLALTGLFSSILNPVGALQLALGRADLGFYWNLALLLFIPASLWIGSFWELTGVALSLVILKFLSLIISWRSMIYPLCHAGLSEYFSNIFRPILLSLISAAIGSFVLFLFDNSILQLAFGSIIVFPLYYFMNIWINKSFIKELKEFIGIPAGKNSLLLFK